MGGVILVIVLFEEKCLLCSTKLAGTIELGDQHSRTLGDFETDHAVDVQNAGSHRVLKAVNATGRCQACGTVFYYKTFSVMQMQVKAEAVPGNE